MVREPFLRTFKYCFYFHTVETQNERSLVTNRNSPLASDMAGQCLTDS